jgi:hypothetical protein
LAGRWAGNTRYSPDGDGAGAASTIVVLLMLLPIVIIAGVVWIGRTRRINVPHAVEAWVTSSWAPVAIGIVSTLIMWIVWGSLTDTGTVHDERAYVLQARIFALGRWTGAPPPIAAFFEQMHVLIHPRLAAKYPPGHSLLLVPGVWLGLPGLMPILLSGVTGALLWVIVRQIAGAVPTLVAWSLYAASMARLLWATSYFSELTSGALWLLSLWALLRWRRDRRWFDLAIIIGATAWISITRPLTAVALGLPTGAVILRDLRNDRRRWRQLGVAVALAAPIVFLNLLWQYQTSGEWLKNPYQEYSRIYFPFDKPGFGLDSAPPLREVPPEMSTVGAQFLETHREHQPLALPAILLRQTISLLLDLGQPSRMFLIPLFLSGALRARGPLLFGVLSMVSMLLAYLSFAHPSSWIVYYFEVFPVFYVVAAIEAVRLADWRSAIGPARARGLVLLALAVISPWLLNDLRLVRRQVDLRNAFHRTAARVLKTLPADPAVVFVRYPETHDFNLSLITNTPDYRSAPLWLVYDRGERNRELLQLTTRPAYLLNVATWQLTRIR